LSSLSTFLSDSAIFFVSSTSTPFISRCSLRIYP
jgi:hypothetical protein